ncbi:19689_t:CDS:1, partial [Funneliformis geosporum]
SFLQSTPSQSEIHVYDRWTIDISNEEDGNFIFIAIENKYMKNTNENSTRVSINIHRDTSTDFEPLFIV